MSNASLHTTTLDRLNKYVDLQRYPIHELNSVGGRDMIANAHEMMARDTLCFMPGFLRADAVTKIVAEIEAMSAESHRIDYPCTAYAWTNNEGFPPEHPRSALLRRKCGVLTTDQLNEYGPCQELFQFDELTEAIRAMLHFDTLFRSACPTLAIQINVMNEGDCFPWHFDTNDGVVSFMIQNADDGGAFEYAPLIRDEDAENYAGVSRILSGRDEPSRVEMPAGTLSLFLGRRSIHRVAPVGATVQSRLSLLYSYDRKPDMRFPQSSCDRICNPSPEPYRGGVAAN